MGHGDAGRARYRIVKIALTLAGIVALIAAGVGGLYLYSPFAALGLVNALTPGDFRVERIGRDIAFRDGPRGRLDIYARPTRDGVKKPVLIFFYGGGWAGGRRQDYAFAAQAYAAKGFVVVMPDYRLVPEVHFPVFVDDAAAAVRWTHDHIADFGGDPGRITLAGHSAGGYLAVMLALNGSYLKAAGVDPKVVRAAAGLAGPYDFYPFEEDYSRNAMGNWPDPAATQPITFARADAPPLWLANGTTDQVVSPHNAINLTKREEELGNRTTVLREYPGLSHVEMVTALSKPFRYKAPVLAESAAFLLAHSR